MIKTFNIIYNDKEDAFYMIRQNKGKMVELNEDGKYGIRVGYNINEQPICIHLPDASTILGLDCVKLKEFTR